ncbi:formimidoylglutamate deiminase (plasmid) [Pseudorhodobacter turbinis]|uniref:Formimidoylglutamate deiminase n=1 Tax=Pseudorhodobacter turbinis TaxID=2500533 RepID=A0A4P8EJ99_9RHOB|nr:formimidoylglutamate deiminase [Pseudorhodobacter turbinis]QCO57048.1 formimidoylglutamate deiminase [Pseudorhodobacter turbinis]
MSIIYAEQALLPDGWAQDVAITHSGGRITAVEAGASPQGMRVGTLLPAPVNLHSHAFQRAMAGLTERRGPDPRDSFWTWRQLMYRFLDRLTPEDVEAISAFVQMEMAEAGYGAVAEFHYLHHAPGGTAYDNRAEMAARVAAASARTGLGLTMLPVLYQFGGCDGRALGPGQNRFGNTPEEFVDLLEGAAAAIKTLPADTVLGVAPHSLRAVSEEALALAATLRPDAPIHMHLAEQTAEVDEVLTHRGARPTEWLLANADVDSRWCLIHCTQMEPHETKGLAATGAVAGLCPITESSLGDGIFDGVAYAQAGGRWGIGSDSNIRISLSEELRTLDYSQRLRDRSRAALATADKSTGRVLFETAAKGGAQAGGRDAGTIEVGKLADLVALDASGPDMAGRQGDTTLDAFIFAGDDRMVTDLWSAGRHLVTGGRHHDHDAITAAYTACVTKLRDL